MCKLFGYYEKLKDIFVVDEFIYVVVYFIYFEIEVNYYFKGL